MDPTQWDLPYPLLVAALYVIVFLRANGTFWLGRAAAAGVRRTRLARLLASPGYRRAAQRIDRYGAPVIALSFLTVGFQTLANLAAGATGMLQRHYLPAVAVGSLLWALLYATLGTVGLDLFGRLYQLSPPAAVTAGITIVAGFIGYLFWHRQRAAKTAVEPDED